MHIDHTTLRTNDLEKNKDFFVEIFGLVPGLRPAVFVASIDGYWLYWKDAPLVHLIKSAADYTGTGQDAEAIDHTAFFMEDYEGFKQKLIELNINFSQMELPEMNERRIFLRTPTNILLETVFRTGL